MKITCSILLVAFLVLLPPSSAEQPDQRGFEKYTPTKIEWMVVWANSFLRVDNLAAARFSISYRVGSDPNTMEMLVSHLTDVERSIMNLAVEAQREFIEKEKKKRGWDWLRVKEVFWNLERK